MERAWERSWGRAVRARRRRARRRRIGPMIQQQSAVSSQLPPSAAILRPFGPEQI
jgi:hypothetical protein